MAESTPFARRVRALVRSIPRGKVASYGQVARMAGNPRGARGVGFIMMQKSVYCRMLMNQSQERAVLEIIRRNRPAKGIVQVLSVTEKQFSRIEYITGEFHTDVVTGDERVVIL